MSQVLPASTLAAPNGNALSTVERNSSSAAAQLASVHTTSSFGSQTLTCTSLCQFNAGNIINDEEVMGRVPIIAEARSRLVASMIHTEDRLRPTASMIFAEDGSRPMASLIAMIVPVGQEALLLTLRLLESFHIPPNNDSMICAEAGLKLIGLPSLLFIPPNNDSIIYAEDRLRRTAPLSAMTAAVDINALSSIAQILIHLI